GLSGSPWLIGIWRFRPFVRMVICCAAALMTASPSASANASANRIHRADARVRCMWGSYNGHAWYADERADAPREHAIRVREDVITTMSRLRLGSIVVD